MVNKTLQKIKEFLKKVLFFFVILLFAFITGTFFPNFYSKHQIKLKVESDYTNWANNLGLNEPAFEYTNDKQFVDAVRKCADWVNFETPRYERVPVEMIIAQAALESGWGTSRFAIEGNNLFGIRTFDKEVPHMLLEGRKRWPGWGVRIFPTKCQGVKFFVDLLNNHSAYEEFRSVRKRMLIWNEELDPKKLVRTLHNYSTTDDYAERVIYIIDRIRKQEQQSGEIKIEVKEDSHVVPEKKPKDLTK